MASDEAARESWRLKHRAERERARRKRPPGEPGRNPLRMPLLIRLIFVLAGLAILVPATGYYLYAHYRASAAQSWPRAEGRVLSSNFRSHYSESDSSSRRSGGSTSYYADVSYAYDVGGVRYHSDNVWLNGPSSTHRPEEAQAVVDAHPVGGPAHASYNPDDPTDVALVLNRPRWQLLFFTGFGLVWLSATYAFNRRVRPAEGRQPRLSPRLRDRLTCLGVVAWFGAIVGTILYFMFFF